MTMNNDNYAEELFELALNSVFPSSEKIDDNILKEITHFLETHEISVPKEDAEIVRGEIRKALIHFKNRKYLYNTRKKIEQLLKPNDNWRKFVISPISYMEEIRKAGLSDEEIKNLITALQSAERTWRLLKTIPSPSSS